MKKHIIIATAAALLQFTVVACHADEASPFVTALKLVGSYVSSNGVQDVGIGFTNIGGKSPQEAPFLGQALEVVGIGKIGVDRLQLGIEHGTLFTPGKNIETVGLEASWHLWKASQVGKVFAFNFNDLGLTVGVGFPVEWFAGNKIRASQIVPHVAAFIHF